MLSKIFAFGFMFLCVAGCCAEAQDRRTDVRFQLFQNSIIVVPVFIDGHGPYNFVLDTGTESSMVDPELFRELGLAAVDQLTLYSVNGQNNLIRTFLPEISIGGVSRMNLEVLVERAHHEALLNPGIRGVIGQNFLSHFNFMLDYEHRVVSFFPHAGEAAPIAGRPIPLDYPHGCPALTAKAINGSDLHLLLDSGSSTLALFKTETPGFAGCGTFQCSGVLTTAISASRVTRGTMAALSVGKTRLNGIPAFSLKPEPGESSMLIDGLLPTSLFQKIYFNNRQRYAIVSHSME